MKKNRVPITDVIAAKLLPRAFLKEHGGWFKVSSIQGQAVWEVDLEFETKDEIYSVKLPGPQAEELMRTLHQAGIQP